MVMCGLFNFFMKQIITAPILLLFDSKNNFFRQCTWFKFNNFGLVKAIVFKFDSSVVKELKLKIKKFLVLIAAFGDVTGEKCLKGGYFFVFQNKVKGKNTSFS